MRRFLKVWGPRPVAKVLLMVALLCFTASQALAIGSVPSSLFANLSDPIGVAATRDRLFVTPYCNDPRQLLSFDSNGNMSVFATLPNRGPGCYEDYVAVSPGLGGFPANYIYVVQGSNIVQVSADGSAVTHFATVPGLPPDHNGISFDAVGTFGYDMIIASENGTIWRVNAAGTPTFVANAGTMLEGPVVAPMSFAPYGGQVVAAAENASGAYAISAAGVVTRIATVPGAESVHIIPQNVCNFGSTGGAFFSAMYPTHIQKFPAADFTGYGDQLLVTGEGGGIWKLKSQGGAIVTEQFNGNIGQHEGSAFVDCAVPPCSISPLLNWNAPLSDAVPADVSAGGTLPIRFTYGQCSGFIHDESVIILITAHNQPDQVITAWVYGSDITINDLTHLYAQDFHAGDYGLTAGQMLDVQVYIGDALVGQAQMHVTP